MLTVRVQPGETSPRLNVLVTEDRPHAPEHWSRQIGRLLEPMGILAHLAATAQQAIDVADRMTIHAAVVDLGTPLGEARTTHGGMWLIELFRRLPGKPPVVLINSPAYSQRQADRLLREALSLGAFSVMNKPIDIEQLLTVFRRLIDRQYKGAWPIGQPEPRDLN